MVLTQKIGAGSIAETRVHSTLIDIYKTHMHDIKHYQIQFNLNIN